MNDCPGTDALTTIASALEWDVEDGLRHLSSCADCAQQLRIVQTTHAAYEEHEVVPDSMVALITKQLAEQAAHETVRGRRAQSLANVVEALLAGGTAVTVLNTGGLSTPIDLSATVFAMVATSLFSYRVWRSNQATASASSAPSIQ
jgi:hypothetical protein